MKVCLIKYNAGNTLSVSNALLRLGLEPTVSDDPEQITNADRVIFPGVGEANSAMKYLKKKGLDKVIIHLVQPFLGICLGMQLMCRYSEENDTKCLGIFESQTIKFRWGQGSPSLKIPHMGWNSLHQVKGPLMNGLKDRDFCYFVHSYYVPIGPETTAITHYGSPFSAGMSKGNFHAVQFHPEKSAEPGNKILQNFLVSSHLNTHK